MKASDFSPAVKRVAWGYVLLHFDINIGTLDLLPAWLGFALFFSALPVLAEASPTAKLLRPFAAGLAVWNGISWIFGSAWCPEILNVVESVIGLYFHFQLLTELANLARHYGCSQEQKLLTLRTVNTVLQTVFILGTWLWEAWEGVAMILLIVNLVVLVWICEVLFGLRKELDNADAMRNAEE